MRSQDNFFMQQGFIHFPRHACPLDMPAIEQALGRLCDRARSENRGAPGIVSVFEANNPDLLCRIEYLAGSDAFFADVLVPQLKTLIERQIGQAVNLFKDKCNFKHPGGGGFTPHQDVVAYRPFGSDYQVTAAVMLDAANETNGALEMAHIWGCGNNEGEWVTTPRGKQPLLPRYQGGTRNGDISDRLSQTMQWRRIDTAPGDVVLFDSYIPIAHVLTARNLRGASCFSLSTSPVKAIFIISTISASGRRRMIRCSMYQRRRCIAPVMKPTALSPAPSNR
ncbi:phytanoyl-CoA dioxygenase family protein [Mixta hanseatica]|uniref:phytanoyl-CoA dioxygenase family protein n=1 Tax=Mixta hanseatica TaxID=2872648 RepID=UPI00201D7187|nr:phytanoyl-CoA dioxygenase family protein [Mixta hanseatica]